MTYVTHKDIITRWPSIAVYAVDIGISENTAKQMNKRNSIGPDHWQATVSAAKKRGYDGITLELLLALRPSRLSVRANDNDKQPAAQPGPVFVAAGE